MSIGTVSKDEKLVKSQMLAVQYPFPTASFHGHRSRGVHSFTSPRPSLSRLLSQHHQERGPGTLLNRLR